ncbi:hypothetical protein ACR9YC_12110 [Parasphingorhabdus sp. DH2-15]|uniref:hypothetical protein n=1 Tax=Parasphingorhabdus sp. DH2-15 TaxID=3444112 RepID=UPI003F687837
MNAKESNKRLYMPHIKNSAQKSIFLICALSSYIGIAAASPLYGQSKIPTPKALEDIAVCQQIQDDDERLKCFDRTVAVLNEATSRGDVIVAEKEVVDQARKEVFGLSLSDNPILGNTDDVGVKSIDTVITSAAQTRSGKWIFVVEGGASWRQTDTKPLRRRPKAGQKVTIERGLLGSFIARLEGQKKTVKVIRIR